MHQEAAPQTPQRDNGNPPEWYWIIAFPLATGARYLLKPDGVSTITGVVWWVGTFVGALVVLWIAWEIGKRVRQP